MTNMHEADAAIESCCAYIKHHSIMEELRLHATQFSICTYVICPYMNALFAIRAHENQNVRSPLTRAFCGRKVKRCGSEINQWLPFECGSVELP